MTRNVFQCRIWVRLNAEGVYVCIYPGLCLFQMRAFIFCGFALKYKTIIVLDSDHTPANIDTERVIEYVKINCKGLGFFQRVGVLYKFKIICLVIQRQESVGIISRGRILEEY